MLDRVMKFTKVHMFIIGLVALVLGAIVYNTPYITDGFMGNLLGASPTAVKMSGGELVRVGGNLEGFRYAGEDSDTPVCGRCNNSRPCGCSRSSKSSTRQNGSVSQNGSTSQKPAPIAPCPRVMEPDLSKYILKSQIPVCNKSTMPEMTNYMLKTECPPVPDLSKYVLKSSIPKPQPVIIDNSTCKKDAGECPPCPRPRCPVVTCPAPTKCPPPAPCPRPVCPPTVVKCKSEEVNQPTVRPFLAPLNMGGFGSA